MPRLTLPKLIERLGALSGAVLFLHGEEEYLRDQAVQRVVAAVLEPGMAAFNLDQLRGGDTVPETLASLVATPPMMADRRVVLVRDVQGLSPKTREVVEAALKDPAPGVVLLLVGTIPGGSKAKFYDILRSDALTVEFPALHVHDLPGWVIEQARAVHGVEVEIEAARALSAAIGSQLGVLTTELEKVVAFAGGRRHITLEDIKAVGGYIPKVDRWAWFDRIGERKFAQAIRDLPELLDSGETAVALVIGMTSHLLKVGLAVAGGPDALERALSAKQRWVASRVGPQARGWTSREIDVALAELLRADRLLKSASLTDRQAMEELLLRLMGSVTTRRPARSPAAPTSHR